MIRFMLVIFYIFFLTNNFLYSKTYFKQNKSFSFINTNIINKANYKKNIEILNKNDKNSQYRLISEKNYTKYENDKSKRGLFSGLKNFFTKNNSKKNKGRKVFYKDRYFEKTVDDSSSHFDSERNFLVSVSSYYQESACAGKLNDYFMPNGKTELLVMQHGIANDLGIVPDIYAEWLGVLPTGEDFGDENSYEFKSNFTISPSVENWGINFYAQKNLTNKIAFSILIPFEEVRTNLNLREYNISGQNTINNIVDPGVTDNPVFYNEPFNVEQAFSSVFLKYGKIDNKDHVYSGLSDIELSLIKKYFFNEKVNFDIYSKLIIPTGNKPKIEYLLEPVVGNGNHFGLAGGINLTCKIDDNFIFLNSFEYKYLISAEEKRSFDLKNGQWSRYLRVTDGKPFWRPDFLINHLTQDVNVSPGSEINYAFAINFKHRDKFSLLFGSNINARANERISIKKGFNKNIGIAYYDSEANIYAGYVEDEAYKATYPQAKINKSMVIPQRNSFITIKESDIDLDSARIKNSFAINYFANLIFYGHMDDRPLEFSLGSHYQKTHSNNSLNLWGIWTNITLKI
ncbi:hypothetical protein GF385_00130 [Candidatus Dependentiae bacterium]|nr:hypothetical protein [Candidatus Dependentiae bacterium]